MPELRIGGPPQLVDAACGETEDRRPALVAMRSPPPEAVGADVRVVCLAQTLAGLFVTAITGRLTSARVNGDRILDLARISEYAPDPDQLDPRTLLLSQVCQRPGNSLARLWSRQRWRLRRRRDRYGHQT